MWSACNIQVKILSGQTESVAGNVEQAHRVSHGSRWDSPGREHREKEIKWKQSPWERSHLRARSGIKNRKQRAVTGDKRRRRRLQRWAIVANSTVMWQKIRAKMGPLDSLEIERSLNLEEKNTHTHRKGMVEIRLAKCRSVLKLSHEYKGVYYNISTYIHVWKFFSNKKLKNWKQINT